MRFICFLFAVLLTSGCGAKININSLDQNQQCENDLKAIVYKNFDMKEIKNKDITFDFSEKDYIQVFVKSKSGVNNGATFGWIKIDKKNNKLYNVTYDNENETPMNTLGKNDYIDKCF